MLNNRNKKVSDNRLKKIINETLTELVDHDFMGSKQFMDIFIKLENGYLIYFGDLIGGLIKNMESGYEK